MDPNRFAIWSIEFQVRLEFSLMRHPTYSEISDGWFYLRLPERVTLEEYEAHPSPAQREETRRILGVFRREVQNSLARVDSPTLQPTKSNLVQLDAWLKPQALEQTLSSAVPSDSNNSFKLALSEVAVFLGDVAVNDLGATWRFARMPNYQQSTVLCEGLELFVWDVVMKRASSDEGYLTLTERFESFESAVLKIRCRVC